MYELIFRGSLLQYWKKIRAECQRLSSKNPLAPEPFKLSHTRPPEEFEEVTIEFLDQQRRLGLVTVDALSGADGKSVKLMVHIEREAYEEADKSALSKWNEIKTAWQEKGWLIDPLTPASQRVLKPKKHGLGRRYDSVKKMLEKIAYRDDWLANHKTAPAWSLKIEGGMDKHTANEINRDVGEAIKKQWNHTSIPGDAFANLLFEKYKHFPNLKVEWEIIKNRGV